jgi:hypothetical protein
MDLSTGLTLAGILVFIGVLIYLANQEYAAAKSPAVSRILLYIVIAMMFLLAPSAYLITLEPEYTGTQLELWVSVGLVTAGIALSYVMVASFGFRQVMVRLTAGGFKPNSSVHIAAVVLAIALFLWNTVPFVMQGGIEGYARSLGQNGISVGEPLITAILQVTVAFLGVGLYIRRSPLQSFERLGLRIPTQQDVITGIGVGFALMLMATAFGIAWQFISPEAAAQQSEASNQIALLFSSLPLALLLAVCTGVGEEIFIRGALQPVFGLIGSSIYFALLHAQYLITPGLLLIFLVSLGLGLLRQRVSTNAAIVAHFTFNFVPLALLGLGLGQ